MKNRPLLSLLCLLAASASLFVASGAVASDLDRDRKAHRACQDRLEAVSRRAHLTLRPGPTFEAPQPAAGQHHYYINARVPGDAARRYRVECEATRVGRVTYFALERGRFVYEAPENRGVAAR
jgi:hypothetical protein